MSAQHSNAAAPIRYDYLDALRGWAFLGVLSVHAAAHTGTHFAGVNYALAGKYGVQLFFMLSAITIFLTLDRGEWNGRWTAREFFVRRFFRILPMFWVGLVLYAFVPGRGTEYAGFHFDAGDYVLTAILQHGWSPRLVNSLVPGGWSIAVEGIFYLVAPLCFRWIKTWQSALWLLLGSLAFAQLTTRGVVALYFGGHLFVGEPRPLIGKFLYYWFPMQLPVFACGILVYQLGKPAQTHAFNRATGLTLLATAVAWLALSVDIKKHGWLEEHDFFAFGFAGLILAMRAWPSVVIVNPATRFLGRISYSAYLLHFAVLELASNSLGTFIEPEWQDSLPAFAALFALTLAGTAPVAWYAYRVVERPAIDLGAALIRRWRAAKAGIEDTTVALLPTPR